VFTNRREPPSITALDAATRARFDLGQLVFNSQWVVAGTPRAERRDGLGPLFIGASCDGCHNNGARGQGLGNERLRRDDLLPNSFVMQLGGTHAQPYGDVLNTSAIAGFVREASLRVTFEYVTGRYPDGTPWTLRKPRYEVIAPGYGPLSAATILRPRVGPALYGVGLLESVPADFVARLRRSQPRAQRGELPWRSFAGANALGRFGWQADAVSVQDQTERALAREMGLTSVGRTQDDCTPQQVACRTAEQGGSPAGTPEVSPEFLDALLTFQRELAVPQGKPTAELTSAGDGGAQLFARVGCAVCHQPEVAAATAAGPQTIRPYTDLLVHDMGDGLADRRVGGRSVPSRWRTAPLWGMAYALDGRDAVLLHDGRARGLEEAVLWHGGQAAAAQRRFMALPAADRTRLLAWLASL
jgi:CxxC motif-containing protein (DUF1111 family)